MKFIKITILIKLLFLWTYKSSPSQTFPTFSSEDYKQLDSIIKSPPVLASEEEIISSQGIVPINQNFYPKFMEVDKQKVNQAYDQKYQSQLTQNNKNLIYMPESKSYYMPDKQILLVPEEQISANLNTNNFLMPDDTNDPMIKKLIEKQEADYDKYFNNFNKQQYEKVQNYIGKNKVFNKEIENVVNSKENMLNYKDVVNKYSAMMENRIVDLAKNNTYKVPIIDIPESREKILNLTQSLQNEIFEPKRFYKMFSEFSSDKINPMRKDDLKKKTSENKNIKGSKREENFKFLQKNKKHEAIPKLNENSVFNNEIISKIKEINKKKKIKNRAQLLNCNNNCDKTCMRIEEIKPEEIPAVCKLKCYLACSNNIISILLN